MKGKLKAGPFYKGCRQSVTPIALEPNSVVTIENIEDDPIFGRRYLVNTCDGPMWAEANCFEWVDLGGGVI